MKIGVVGGGVVGKATARCWIEHCQEVRVWDKLLERRTVRFLIDVLDCDLVFICLPTPQKAGLLECDVTALEQFFTGLGVSSPEHPARNTNFVLKSTVPIGYTRKTAERFRLPNLVHSPEFLTARCAEADAMLPSRNVIGIPMEDSNKWEFDNGCFHVLHESYERRFPAVPICVTSSDESEAVKLIQNSLFAVTVAYWNEARALADKLGLCWERVQEAILLDGRVGRSHARVPGPDGRRGFGGSCLPKDLANLIQCMDEQDLSSVVTYAAHQRNNRDREAKP